jgi:uncharacterized damage-inducible protein DinB
MQVTSVFQRQLATARETSERYLEDFKTPEQWTYQVHDKANHALWFAGHMGQTDNFLISLIAPEKAAAKEGWSEKFGMGSRPTNNPEDYPPVVEVLDYMRDRRRVVMDILAGLAEEDLDRPTPDGAPDFLATVRQVFELAVWHEGIHVGQLTVARRALGHPPLVDMPPEAPAE